VTEYAIFLHELAQ